MRIEAPCREHPVWEGRRARAIVLMLVLLISVTVDGAVPSFAGRSLPEAFDVLETMGIPIVYSDALVTPRMRVIEEPTSTDPETVLREILAPHGLAIRKVADRYYVVASDEEHDPSGEATDQPIRGNSFAYLEEITVSPGQMTLAGEIPEDRKLLTNEHLEAMPHPGDDVMRAVQAVPGVSSDDASARFHVRGGATDELLVMVDGQEVYEPFHLKDFMSVFSALDSEAIELVDIYAGGFPVQFGDRMSGVMDVSVIAPKEPRAEITVGTLHSRLLLAGALGDLRGAWLLTGRVWYPETLPKRAGVVTVDELQTDYYDVLGRASWTLDPRRELFGGLLIAYDDLAFETIEDEEVDRVDARYASDQLWAGLAMQWSPAVSFDTVLSGSHIDRERAGGYISPDDGNVSVADDRRFEFYGLRQSATWQRGSNHLIKGGFEVRKQQAEYDYRRTDGAPAKQSQQILEPHATTSALWLSDRARFDDLVVELGVRFDTQSHLDEDQFSPRLNVRWQFTPDTALRVGLGRYHQTERLNELQVQDGVTQFARPQSSDQLMASLEHQVRPGLTVRLSGWDKKYADLRPRWENQFNPIELFPEVEADRIMIAPTEGRARGAELVISRSPMDRVSWWAGYTYANAFDLIDGVEVPRRWDIRHTLDLGLDLKLPRRWRLSLGGRLSSGRPITEGVVVEEDGELIVEPGPYNAGRLPDYRRLDLRLSREIPTSKGQLLIIFEALNITNENNVCCIDDFSIEGSGSQAVAVPDYRGWAPFVPSLAARWSF